jgi:TM2 domain-containing membrane protein YozV
MSEETQGKSKVLAGLLGIFPPTGALGIHRFYLGYTKLGIIHIALLGGGLLLSLVVIGIPIVIGNIVWGLIEGIMILAGSISKDAAGRSLIK